MPCRLQSYNKLEKVGVEVAESLHNSGSKQGIGQNPRQKDIRTECPVVIFLLGSSVGFTVHLGWFRLENVECIFVGSISLFGCRRSFNRDFRLA